MQVYRRDLMARLTLAVKKIFWVPAILLSHVYGAPFSVRKKVFEAALFPENVHMAGVAVRTSAPRPDLASATVFI